MLYYPFVWYVCAVDITVSITASGTNTAGETYSLECSATVTGSTGQLTITWFDRDSAEISSSNATRMVSATVNRGGGSYSSTLTFNQLSASHAGTYTCRATLGGASDEKSRAVVLGTPGTIYHCMSISS